MKKFILPILLFALVGFSISNLKLTDDERKKAVAELTDSKNQFVGLLEGTTMDQVHFKCDDESWTLAEITEHLALAEGAIFWRVQKSLETPADPSRRSDVKMTDEEVVNLILDRSKKVKTQEPLEPEGKFGSFEESLKSFKEDRAAHIKYIKTTEDDLRNHYIEMPFGLIDAYQGILFMSGHTERHVKQMHEVLSHRNYPEQ